jgi:hypothetical protein
MKTTFRKMLEESYGVTRDDIVHVAPSESALDEEFENRYDGEGGPAFTVWTKNEVYFSVYFNGKEEIMRVLRNPSDQPFDG